MLSSFNFILTALTGRAFFLDPTRWSPRQTSKELGTMGISKMIRQYAFQIQRETSRAFCLIVRLYRPDPYWAMCCVICGEELNIETGLPLRRSMHNALIVMGELSAAVHTRLIMAASRSEALTHLSINHQIKRRVCSRPIMVDFQAVAPITSGGFCGRVRGLRNSLRPPLLDLTPRLTARVPCCSRAKARAKRNASVACRVRSPMVKAALQSQALEL